ncbi:MAG TPA: glycosyltransferase family 1 protein [Candidatus Nanopusillus sp.]|nr:glycosyltransferase family 1 protein [Candidatus Nanopusillus sp.]
MDKITLKFVLFHSFEKFYKNLDREKLSTLGSHANKLLNSFPLELRKNTELIALTTSNKKIELEHRYKYKIRLFPVTFFKNIIPVEISLPLIKEILKVKKSEKNIWHLNTYYYLMFDIIVPILKIKKQKIIAHHRGGGFSWNPIAIPYSIFQYVLMLPILLRLVDKIIVQNKYEYNRLIRQYKINPEKIVWIPNGININLFKPLPEDERNKVKEELGFEKDEFIVLYVGRIMKGKGILKLPEIIEKLVNNYNTQRIKFFIVGDGEDKERLIKMLRKKRLLDYVKFSEGYITDIHQLVRYYNTGDILIHLNINPKFEGSPNVILEAQACGLPVIGFDIPGVQDSIVNGKTGFLVKRKDYESYIKKIYILYSNQELYKEMKVNARDHIIKNFNIRNIIRKYIEIYRSVICDSDEKRSGEGRFI